MFGAIEVVQTFGIFDILPVFAQGLPSLGTCSRPARQPTDQAAKASQPGRPGGPAGLVWDRFGARKAIIHQIQVQSRPISNRVPSKVTQDDPKVIPQRPAEG